MRIVQLFESGPAELFVKTGKTTATAGYELMA
jgi:hypothetical protein